MSSESTAATLSSLSHIVDIADSIIMSLMPAASWTALKALGLIIISIFKLLFSKIIVVGLLGSPLYPINLFLSINSNSLLSFNIFKLLPSILNPFISFQ